MEAFQELTVAQWFVCIGFTYFTFHLMFLNQKDVAEKRPILIRLSVPFFLFGLLMMFTLSYFVFESKASVNYQDISGWQLLQ